MLLINPAAAAAPIGHRYPVPLGCDPSYVNGTHPYAAAYARHGGRTVASSIVLAFSTHEQWRSWEGHAGTNGSRG